MNGGNDKDASGRWTRRRMLLSIPMGIGGLALISRLRLSLRKRLSGRVADHWEIIKRDGQ